eukprot:CAMPEP_0203680186 /NCGR_PEP_ID=MMETSP0090-20130426/38321_1 /ASSEMBLY_ACC=CAM_ASM_001088 /TAXON_ID=426623 /ORGANISM="Chaetoceros affinis, Strain CCMP159" /LENGTH=488 /DNA_ID=CAMNT_0050548137 /DNA_START=37 /DNA_END=1503 /DNA_ORIENTATION=+
MVKMRRNPFSRKKSKSKKETAPPEERGEPAPEHHHALYIELRSKALEVSVAEPFMKSLLLKTFLHPNVHNFNSAISRTIASRLISSCGNNPTFCAEQMTSIFEDAMKSPILEYGSTMADAVCEDILACTRRDPACKSGLEIVLFYKGFASLVCHRAARRHYNVHNSNDGSASSRYVSLWLQSQASAAFGVDIHPAAEIGSGVFFDHASGLVIGETAVVGNNCTLLHGVTLGGTGKVSGNRHPKVGNNVLIGAGSSILGNITIGDCAKIGAGSIVLRPIPHGATAVGAPAKIIGWAKENDPASMIDNTLDNVVEIGAQGEESPGVSTTSSDVFTDDSSTENGEKNSESAKDVEVENTDEGSDVSKMGKSIKDTEEETQMKIERKSREKSNTRQHSHRTLCLFRRSHTPRRDSLSYSNLYDNLSDLCTEAEIGEVYLELLKKEKKKDFVCKREAAINFPQVIKKYTNLDTEKCELARQRLLPNGQFCGPT